MPLKKLKQWIDEEKIAGVPNPAQAVLATCTKAAIPHSRVIAIREITETSLLFFTQQVTRKVTELAENPLVSLNFWFELTQRQVIIEGGVTPLSKEENQLYWSNYPRFAQVRFCAYAPTSSQEITSKENLEDKKKIIEQQYKQEQEIPMPAEYCGYRINPVSFLFYLYRLDELSDVYKYIKDSDSSWKKLLISP